MSTDSVARESYRKNRVRRIGFSVAVSLLARGFGMVVTLITVPLTLNYLGSERYAIWVTLSSISALLAFADLGIGNGLINKIAEANGKDDRQLAQRYVSNAFFMLLTTAVILVLLLLLTYSSISWSGLFNVSSSAAVMEAGPVTAVFLLSFLIGIPLSLVQKIQIGFQEIYIENLWFIFGKLLSVIGVVVAIQFDMGFIWLCLAFVGFPLLMTTLNAAQLFKKRPWLLPSIHSVDTSIIVGLMRIGWLFFVLQVASTFAFNIDNLIIIQIVSSEAVTNYSIPAQLFKLAITLIGLISLPLWPAYGEAIARHDVAWVRRTFIYSLLVNFLASALISIVLLVAGNKIIGIWIGRPFTVDNTLMVMLAIWTILYSVSNALAMLFNAANVIRFQVIFASLMAVSNLGLSILFTHIFGTPGVLLGSIVSYLLFIFPPYFLRTSKLFADLRTASKPG